MRIGVFCGSKMGRTGAYEAGVRGFVDSVANTSASLLYGGATVGLMGVFAEHALQHGIDIIGVIPKKLVDIEQSHPGLTQMHVVESMEERKAVMAKLSDCFVMLPGGTGSLDEFFEMFTLTQLGYHHKPCAILNSNGYYDHLIQFLDHATTEGFLSAESRKMIITVDSVEDLLKQLNITEGV